MKVSSPSATDLVEPSLLQQLRPLLWGGGHCAVAIPQEVEDACKVLGVTVDEVAALRMHSQHAQRACMAQGSLSVLAWVTR